MAWTNRFSGLPTLTDIVTSAPADTYVAGEFTIPQGGRRFPYFRNAPIAYVDLAGIGALQHPSILRVNARVTGISAVLKALGAGVLLYGTTRYDHTLAFVSGDDRWRAQTSENLTISNIGGASDPVVTVRQLRFYFNSTALAFVIPDSGFGSYSVAANTQSFWYSKDDGVTWVRIGDRVIDSGMLSNLVRVGIGAENENGWDLTSRTVTFSGLEVDEEIAPNPYLTSRFPANTGITEDAGTLVSFNVLDANNDFDLSTLNITVDIGGGPVAAYTGGVGFIAPFDGASSSVTPIANGYTVVVDHSADYPAALITVNVTGQDALGNALNESWSFTVNIFVDNTLWAMATQRGSKVLSYSLDQGTTWVPVDCSMLNVSGEMLQGLWGPTSVRKIYVGAAETSLSSNYGVWSYDGSWHLEDADAPLTDPAGYRHTDQTIWCSDNDDLVCVVGRELNGYNSIIRARPGPPGTLWATEYSTGDGSGVLCDIHGSPDGSAVFAVLAFINERVVAEHLNLTGLSGTVGDEDVHMITIPAGMDWLIVNFTGPSGDGDLYLRHGAPPTTAVFDHRSWNSGTDESIKVATPAAGDWYIMRHAYSSYADARLTASTGDDAPGSSALLKRDSATGSWSEVAAIDDININGFQQLRVVSETEVWITARWNTPSVGRIYKWDGVTLSMEHEEGSLSNEGFIGLWMAKNGSEGWALFQVSGPGGESDYFLRYDGTSWAFDQGEQYRRVSSDITQRDGIPDSAIALFTDSSLRKYVASTWDNTYDYSYPDPGNRIGVTTSAIILRYFEYAPVAPVYADIYTKTYLPALYIDSISDEATVADMLLINKIPDNGAIDVPVDATPRLTIVSILPDDISIATIQFQSALAGSTTPVYTLAGGGFQAGYSGTATLQASPSSVNDDELVLTIVPDVPFTSLDVITVLVTAETVGGATLSESYSFTIEDATPPELDSINWLSPQRALVKFTEPVKQLTTPGGARFVHYSQGQVSLSAPNQVTLLGATPLFSWIGKYIGITKSYYPTNNKARLITAVNAVTNSLTVDTTEFGVLIDDDGIDTDDTDRIVRERDIRASVSPYRFRFRQDDEATGKLENDSTRVQCGFEPIVTEIWPAASYEVPALEDPDAYVFLNLDQDISFGRLYRLDAIGIEDAVGNVITANYLEFSTPMFGVNPERLGFWSDKILAATDKAQDAHSGHGLRKIAVVLQDIYYSLLYRIDQLQYLQSADRCPDHWVPFLLANLANPFNFPLETLRDQRLLAESLPQLYERIGVSAAIEGMIKTLLDIDITILPYVRDDWWILGHTLRGRLGNTTKLGPGTEYAANCYDIDSAVDLTVYQRRVIRQVSEWADPAGMHLVDIIEPSIPKP